MNILLPAKIEHDLIAALSKAKRREIGGILMGKHVSENTYRIKAITIQRHGGRVASLIRTVRDIITPLRRFFHETGHDYTRFNYLGEWHSHPSFSLEPSGSDINTMWDILDDPDVGANFVVLMIVRLDTQEQLQGSVTVFPSNHQMITGSLIKEATP